MKKLSKLFLSALLCLSIALSTLTPAFAAGVRFKKLTATVTYNTVTLSWQKMAGVTGFEVQQKNGKSWKKLGSTRAVRYTVKKLRTGTKYTFRVVAKKKGGGKVASKAISATPVCPAPQNLRASVLSPVSAKLTWKKVNGATSYNVLKYNAAKKKWFRVASVKTNACTVSALTPNVPTRFRVRAVTRVGKRNAYGKLSKIATVKTSIPTPVLSFTGSTPNSAKLAWSKVQGATDYVVYTVDGSKYTQAAVSKTTGATVSKLSPNKVYTFSVRARVGKALSSPSASVKGKTAPAAVSKFSAAAVNADSVTLKWTDTQNAEKFEIYQVKDGKDVLIATVKKGVSEYTVTGLEDATEYSFKIRAFGLYAGKSLTGAISAPVSATTLPLAVKNLRFDNATDSSVTISWIGANEAAEFTVEKSTNKKNWTRVAVVKSEDGSERTSYTLSGLSNSTVLYLRVTASGEESGVTPSSNPVTVKTVPAIPGSIGESINSGAKSAVISWKAVPGADGYTVKNNKTGKTFETKTNSYTASPISVGTEYSFSVSAFINVGGKKLSGKTSSAYTFTPSKLEGISVVNGSTLTQLDSNRVLTIKDTVMWMSDSKKEFVIERNIPSTGSSWSKVGQTKDNSLSVSTDIKAKQTKKSNYVTNISWTAVPGAKEYIIKTTVASNSIATKDELKTKNTSVNLRLAPSTEITVIVQAVADSANYRVKATDPEKKSFDSDYSTTLNIKNAVVGSSSIKFKTPSAPAFSASNAESRELYTLKLVQAINETKSETDEVTVASNVKLEANLKNVSISGIPLFGSLKKELEKEIDEMQKELNENKSQTLTFKNGMATYMAKDKDGNEKMYYQRLNSFISPLPDDNMSNKFAYVYNQHNLNSFSKAVKSVSVSNGSNGKTTVSLTLNQEDANAVYHPGFVQSITDSLGNFSNDVGGASVKATVGASIITGVINKDGTLDSLKITSPFTMDMSVPFTDNGVITIKMNLKGSSTYNYTFKR